MIFDEARIAVTNVTNFNLLIAVCTITWIQNSAILLVVKKKNYRVKKLCNILKTIDAVRPLCKGNSYYNKMQETQLSKDKPFFDVIRRL